MKFLGTGALAVILDACGVARPTETPTLPPIPTPRTPAEATVRSFFDAWIKSDYSAMYKFLAPKSQSDYTYVQFSRVHRNLMSEGTVTGVQPTLTSVEEEGNTATVQYHIHYDLALFGKIDEDNLFSMVNVNEKWGILWSPALILKALAGGNSIKLYPAKSTRGNIYDRNGLPLAIGQDAVLVSVWPAEMRRNQAEGQVLAGLSTMLNQTQYALQRKYGSSNPEWKIPIATVSPDLARANADTLSLPGVVTETQDARSYPQGAAAAHISGYVGPITADELDQVYDQGYREGEFFGRSGLEKWGEKYLSGVRGGRLVVISSKGGEVTTLKERAAQQSMSIYAALDVELQKVADSLLEGKHGSISVMNVKTGEILAMASHPTYDPNVFVDNSRSDERANALTNPDHVLLNRATQGAYPQGSVQKIITESTALERGGMGANTPFT